MQFTVLIVLLCGAFTAMECSDSPQEIGLEFMESFKAAVESRDEARISDLVEYNFIFAGCHYERNRDYLVRYLSSLSKTAKYSITMKSAVGQAGVNVRMEVELEGLFGMSDVVFFIGNKEGSWKIIFIQEINCK